MSESRLKIKFANAYLSAELQVPGKDSKYLSLDTDSICLVDHERLEPILCEDVRYGLRVTVLRIPAKESTINTITRRLDEM